MQPRIVAGTGHRPDKLSAFGVPYSPEQLTSITTLAENWLAAQLSISPHPVTSVISGMALGWDTALALAALRLNIPLTCAIPCPQQPSRWPIPDIARWSDIKALAAQVRITSPFYTHQCMQKRNIWMVDNATEILALYNGSPGGTRNCISYARLRGKPVTNLWQSQE